MLKPGDILLDRETVWMVLFYSEYKDLNKLKIGWYCFQTETKFTEDDISMSNFYDSIRRLGLAWFRDGKQFVPFNDYLAE